MNTFHILLQLKEILLRTIRAWVALFDENHEDQLPKFKLELILDDDDHMQFYPVLSDVEAAVFHVVDSVANTMQNVPTVQVIIILLFQPINFKNFKN
jgi:hypothetical protein